MKIKTMLWAALLACAGAARAAEPVSLAGEWRFKIDEQKVGATEKWFGGALAGETKIKLPGTMDDAGLGPKNTKPPTLEGPYRVYDYAGPAWYQRDIEIPAKWQGQRVTLFLERCRWVTSVWLDDKFIGTQDSLIAPHVYEIGMVSDGNGRDGARPSNGGIAAGKHRLTICVDNTVKINLGRFVSALFGGTWGNMNGIIGRIELAATPPVWIEGVQVYPNLTNNLVLGKVRIANMTGQESHGRISWTVKGEGFNRGGSAGFQCGAGTSVVQTIGSYIGGKRWDEFSPNLFNLSVKIESSDGLVDTREIKTGARDFAAKGTQFTMNGRPVYLRGTLECSIWPLTGYPPTDEAAWHRIYKIMKSYGLNHIRFHSWCPPEAAFAAADEDGIMIQAEGPMANIAAGQDPARDAFIEAEFKRMVDTYGNHPSFCTMTLGNEYGGKDELLSRWVDMLIKRDPRHLYSSASCAQKTANRQWTEEARGRGIPGAGSARDLRDVVASDGRPIIGHEIGQWMYYPDFNEIKKWSGVMALKNFEMIRDDLAKKNQLDLAPLFIEASGKFATLLYKEEIEVLLRTPGYAGFSLLDLHDYPTQGTALIGPLDAFWNAKGFITPAEYARFCGPTVPLLRMPKRTYVADEPFTATADLAHYGAADLDKAQPVWKITDEKNREIAAGALPVVKAPTGKLTGLGEISASLAKVSAPAKLKVTVALQGTEIANDWDIWVYPAAVAAPPPNDFVVCEKWETAKAALAAGKKVIYFALSANSPESMRGRFLPVFWSPVWFPSQKPNTMGLLCDPRHPLFAQFPTEMHSNWQWFDLLQRSRYFVLDDAPAAYRPLVQVIDNFSRNHKLALVFEGRVGAGQLLVCGLDLPYQSKEPAARQLLASLYAYAGSGNFAPKQELGAELLEKLFVTSYANKLLGLGARIRADNQHGGFEAENALDGKPETMWHTPWDDKAPQFPHQLIIELPKPAKFAGLTCLPRQDGNKNGWIKDYAVYVSADGKSWGEPVAKGAFKRGDALQTIKFAQPVETKFLKLVALSPLAPSSAFASLAELDAVLEK